MTASRVNDPSLVGFLKPADVFKRPRSAVGTDKNQSHLSQRGTYASCAFLVTQLLVRS